MAVVVKVGELDEVRVEELEDVAVELADVVPVLEPVVELLCVALNDTDTELVKLAVAVCVDEGELVVVEEADDVFVLELVLLLVAV